MKKIVFTLALTSCLALSLTGCKQELQETRGVVTDMEFDSDTLLCTRIAVDGDTLLFKVNEARMINGMFVKGDSVMINYIEGRNDTLRALVLSVLPKAPHVIEPAKESNDTLVTGKEKPEKPDIPGVPLQEVPGGRSE